MVDLPTFPIKINQMDGMGNIQNPFVFLRRQTFFPKSSTCLEGGLFLFLAVDPWPKLASLSSVGCESFHFMRGCRPRMVNHQQITINIFEFAEMFGKKLFLQAPEVKNGKAYL